MSAPAHCNLILTTSEWLARLPDHGTEHQGHRGAGSRCSWSLCPMHGPGTQRRRDLPLAHGHLISFYLPLEHPSPHRAWAQHRRTSFNLGRRRSLQQDGCWMQIQQLRPGHSQEHTACPLGPLLEKRQLSWRKPFGSPFVVLFSCGGVDGVRASLLPSPCWSWTQCAPGGCLCGQQCVCVSVSVHELKQASDITFASLGLGHSGILQGKTKGLFEDLCSVCEQSLEERRSKKKIGAELKSMVGRD